MANKIAYTAGTFELFHYGHVYFLQRVKHIAESYGCKLIVGVSTDKLVESYKQKPVLSYSARFDVVEACRYVDGVVKQDELIGIKLLKDLNPKIIITLKEWKHLPGIKWAKENGIKVFFIPSTKGISTTLIKEKIKNG